MVAVLICGMVGWWSGFGMALCQGMAWFKRIAVIALVAVGIRLLFRLGDDQKFPHRFVASFRHDGLAAGQLHSVLLVEGYLTAPGLGRFLPWTREFVQVPYRH